LLYDITRIVSNHLQKVLHFESDFLLKAFNCWKLLIIDIVCKVATHRRDCIDKTKVVLK